LCTDCACAAIHGISAATAQALVHIAMAARLR
jgi:hypothetical protein